MFVTISTIMYSPTMLVFLALGIFCGVEIFRYLAWIVKARQFAASAVVPYVYVYHYRSSLYFWVFSPLIAPVLEKLPWKMGQWVRYVKKDFAWHHQGTLHREELGSDVYWTVGPGGPTLQISDAFMITEVYRRWRDFSKQTKHYKFLNLFGQNVNTLNGADWQRHRKITAPSFNERSSSAAFDQSVAQGQAMLYAFTHDASNRLFQPGSEPVVDDFSAWTFTAALYTLSSIAFSVNLPWSTKSILAPKFMEHSLRATSPSSSKQHKMSFRDTLAFFVHLPIVATLPTWFMRYSPSSKLRHLQICTEEFVLYIKEMIVTAKANPPQGDLLSAIVKAADDENENTCLSESETIGNMFIFVAAGSESTGTVMHTILLMLACYPNIQAQVQEEVDNVWADKEEGENWCYETDYPKMRTLMAVILETIRLYPPSVIMVKANDSTPKILTYQPDSFSAPIDIVIPPHGEIAIDVISTHRNPRYYPSPHAFLPSRWLKDASYVPDPNSSAEATGMANMWQPPRGAFIAFSAGARVCLGRKFALVEMVGTITALLKGCSVELVRKGEEMGKGKTESWVECRERALKVINERVSELVMQMQGKVEVRFVRRGKEA